MELQAQGEEKEGEEQGSENVLRFSLLMDHSYGSSTTARLPRTDGKGFPHVSQRRLLAMMRHIYSAARCSNSSFAWLGSGI